MSRRAWHGITPYLALAAITTLLLLLVLKLPMSRLDVPYSLTGDTVDKLTQIHNVAETGWLFHNERLGYPFGYDRLDFPRFDSLNYAIMGSVAALTGSSGLAMNLYFIAGFYLIGFAALYSFRRLGLDMGPALLCALLYSFLPYHVLRGVSHLTNGTYFLVPLAMLVLVWLAQNRLDSATPDMRRHWAFALVVAVLIPLQTPYNGVFFAVLCLVAGAIAFAARMNWRAPAATLVLLAAVAGSFLVEHTPVLLHKMGKSGEASAGIREPYDAELLSLRLSQVLLPTNGHRVSAVAEAKRGFDKAMKMDAPNWANNQYIGALGVLGFLALLWALARAVAARAMPEAEPTAALEGRVRIAALLAIAIILLAISTGVGGLVAYWITAKVRAYNRILPFLAFACLLGTGWVLHATARRINKIWLRNIALAAVGMLALLDSIVQPAFDNRAATIADHDRDRSYFETVEQRLGDGSAVFQIPVVWYPEHPPVNRMSDYEEFKPFLLTNTLRFSYGGAHGREGYAWGRGVEKLPINEVITHVHGMGFAAILIDTRAYADDSLRKAATDGLSQALPQMPLVSADQRWWLFPLAGCCGAPVAQVESGEARAFPYAVNGTPLRFTSTGLGGIYRAGGWAATEGWGTWSLGMRARLRMRLDPPPTGALKLTLDTRMPIGPNLPHRHLRIEGNGQLIGEVDYTLADSSKRLQLTLPAGLVANDSLLELAFVVTPEATPRSAGIGDDDRPLGIGLIELAIASADTDTDTILRAD